MWLFSVENLVLDFKDFCWSRLCKEGHSHLLCGWCTTKGAQDACNNLDQNLVLLYVTREPFRGVKRKEKSTELCFPSNSQCLQCPQAVLLAWYQELLLPARAWPHHRPPSTFPLLLALLPVGPPGGRRQLFCSRTSLGIPVGSIFCLYVRL